MQNYVDIINEINQLDSTRKQLRIEKVSLLSSLYSYRRQYPMIFSDLPGNPDNIEPEDIEVVLEAIKYRVRNSGEVTEKDRIECIKLIDNIEERIRDINIGYEAIDSRLINELGTAKLARENYLEDIHRQTQERMDRIQSLENEIKEYEQGMEDAIEKGLEEEIINSFVNTINNKQKQIENLESEIREIYSQTGLREEIDLYIQEQEKIERQRLEQLNEDARRKLEEEKKQRLENFRRKNIENNFGGQTNEPEEPKPIEQNQQTTGNNQINNQQPIRNDQNNAPQHNAINNFEYELDKEATMQEYRNSGYGQNAFGWFFNPNTDEYEEDYNPLNDPLFQIFNEYELVDVLDEEATMQEYRNSGYGKNAFGWFFNPNTDEYEENYNPLNDPLFQKFKTEKVYRGKNKGNNISQQQNKNIVGKNTPENDKTVGKDGIDGKDGVSITDARINDKGELVLIFSDGKEKNVGRVVGKDGNSISDVKVDENGDIIFIFSDGNQININIGKLVGKDGKNGVGITDANINENGELIFTYSNGEEANLGKITGKDGRDGRDGNSIKYTADELVGDVPIPVTRKAWNWIKKNKNKIIITAGLATIAVGVYIKSKNYQEAVNAVEDAKQVAYNAQTMLDNASAWHTADDFTKNFLHNVSLKHAPNITKLTGDICNYDPPTGIWDIAGHTLQQYSQLAAAKLANAQQVLANLIKTTTGLTIGGLGGTALGVVLPDRKRTEAYTKINDAIRVYNKKYKEIDENDIEFLLDLQQKLQYVEDLKKEEAKLLHEKINDVIEKWREFTHELDEQIIRERIENTESAEEEMIMEEYEEEGPTRSGGRR